MALNSLDTSLPDDFENISQGAARIRETREAVVSAFPGFTENLTPAVTSKYLNTLVDKSSFDYASGDFLIYPKGSADKSVFFTITQEGELHLEPSGIQLKKDGKIVNGTNEGDEFTTKAFVANLYPNKTELANAIAAIVPASLTVPGLVQLSNATNSTSETLAATPKAVKSAYDLAASKWTAVDATSTVKGYVKLSSATNSTSEVLAATPKAVKDVKDYADSTFLKTGTGGGGTVDTLTVTGALSSGSLTSGGATINGTAKVVGSLEVTGAIKAGNNVSAYATVTSDKRVKENIEPITGALEKVNMLNGVTYDRKDYPCPRQVGLIAQDVSWALPEAVVEDSDGLLSVAYGNLVGLLVEAIKELEGKVHELEAKV